MSPLMFSILTHNNRLNKSERYKSAKRIHKQPGLLQREILKSNKIQIQLQLPLKIKSSNLKTRSCAPSTLSFGFSAAGINSTTHFKPAVLIHLYAWLLPWRFRPMKLPEFRSKLWGARSLVFPRRPVWKYERNAVRMSSEGVWHYFASWRNTPKKITHADWRCFQGELNEKCLFTSESKEKQH